MKTNKKYPLILGRPGIDNYCAKFADGTIIPWNSQKESPQNPKILINKKSS